MNHEIEITPKRSESDDWKFKKSGFFCRHSKSGFDEECFGSRDISGLCTNKEIGLWEDCQIAKNDAGSRKKTSVEGVVTQSARGGL
jgi:hypothetical protein